MARARVDRTILRSFLSSYGEDSGLAEHSLVVLEPFFRMAESGDYFLSSAAKFKVSHVAHILHVASFGAIQRVEIVSLSETPIDFPWLPEDAKLKVFRVALGWSAVTASLRALWTGQHPSWFGPEIEEELIDVLESALWLSLSHALAARVIECLGEDKRPSRWASEVWEALFLLLAVTLIGDKVSFGQLKPLVELLSHSILAGQKRDDPETAILFVA